MTEAEQWMVQAITLLVCGFGIMFWLFAMRSKYQKQALDHLWCLFIKPEGPGEFKLLKEVDGFVTLPGKKGGKEKQYPVGEVATISLDYPMGWVPRFLKVKIRAMIYDEKCWEPVYTRGDPLLSPSLLRNIRMEKFTQLGAEQSQREVEEKKKEKQKLNPSTVYLLLITVLVAVVGVAVFILWKFGAIEEMIEKIMQAYGV